MKLPYPIQPARAHAPVRLIHIVAAAVIPLAACAFAYIVTRIFLSLPTP